jgi:hypothetical protein
MSVHSNKRNQRRRFGRQKAAPVYADKRMREAAERRERITGEKPVTLSPLSVFDATTLEERKAVAAHHKA